MNRRVAITGVGAVTPLGVGAGRLHERWRDGESGIEDGIARAGEFDATEFMSAKEARRTDRFTQLAVAAAQEAIENAGWADGPPYEPDAVGCVIGTGIGGLGTIEDAHDVLRDNGPGRVSPLTVPLMMANAGSAALAMRHGLQGQVYGVVSACAAGAHAIGGGMRMIQASDADAAIVGGSEAALTALASAAFAAMDATSTSGISRPFDARRDGFVMGEGGGILILEDEEKARARGAKILGWVRGFGATSDANHMTAPEKNGAGATKAILRALEDAGRQPEDVVYVNAHGTSTPLNDRAETRAIKAAFGDHANNLKVSSTKSTIGHLLGAAGAVEAVATVLALRDRMAPPTLNYEEQEEGMDLDYVPNEAKPLDIGDRPPLAISNAFGFGGHNVVLALEAA